MSNDREKLEEHMKRLLDAIEEDLGDAEWKVENLCTVVEVLNFSDEGGEITYRKRQTGRPSALIGMLRFAEQDVLGDLLRESAAQAQAQPLDEGHGSDVQRSPASD